ncbi:MAG: hypothetical protein ACYDHW_16500 [Syntrophorhabdaceae bacterium]
MNKWLILAVVFVFAVPFQAYCDNHSAVPSSSEITVAQITPVTPPAGNLRTPVPPSPPVAITPQDHALAAAKEMLDAAVQINVQCRRIQGGIASFYKNPAIYQIPMVKQAVEPITLNATCGIAMRQLLEQTQRLEKTIKYIISQGVPTTQGTPSQGTLPKGGPATLPKGGPAK